MKDSLGEHGDGNKDRTRSRSRDKRQKEDLGKRSLDEVKNKDHDDDDTPNCKLDNGTQNSSRHRVGIFPAHPPDVELSSTVDEAVDMRNADNQQHSDGYALCLNKPPNAIAILQY